MCVNVYFCVHLCACVFCVLVVCVVCVVGLSCLAAGWSGMGLSPAVVVILSQWYEACCFIGQPKLLRQGFCWRSEHFPSQMEQHKTFNPFKLDVGVF